MNITRRRLGQIGAGLPLATLASGRAAAQAYPSRPITWVVAYGPGTGTDLLARQIGERVGNILGQRIIVDNRPGASGMIGTEMVARSRPDGYTMLFGNNQTMAVNISFYREIRYDPRRDFTPIARTVSIPYVVVGAPQHVPEPDIAAAATRECSRSHCLSAARMMYFAKTGRSRSLKISSPSWSCGAVQRGGQDTWSDHCP